MPTLAVLCTLLTAAPRQKIVVLEVRSQADLSDEFAESVTAAMLAEVRDRVVGIAVVGPEVRQVPKETAPWLRRGCDDLACLARLGGDLGASRVVAGSLSRLGASYLLTLRLIDVRTVEVLREATARTTDSQKDALFAGLRQAVRELLPPPVDTDTIDGLLQTQAPRPARPHSHTLAWGLVGTAVVSLAVAIVSTVEVANFKSQADRAFRAVNNGAEAPDGIGLKSQQSQAQNLWQPLAVAGFVVAGVTGGASILTW